MSSIEDGVEDGRKGEKDLLRYAFDDDYRKGVDFGEGRKDRSERDNYMEKHPIDGPLADPVWGFEKATRSEEYGAGYDRKSLEEIMAEEDEVEEEEEEFGDSYGGYYGGSSWSGGNGSYSSGDAETIEQVNKQSGWVVFGRLIQILPLFGLALLMGFWENYRLNGPYENIGLPLVYTVFGAALLASALERSPGWGFLIGCMITAGSTLGLSLYPVTGPYVTPGQAIVNGFSFTLLCAFVGWLLGKIFEKSNRSGCLSIILGFLLLGLLVWQLSVLPLGGMKTSIKFPNGILVNLEKVHVAVAALVDQNKPIPIESTVVPTTKPTVKTENNTQRGSASDTYVVAKGDTLWGIANKVYGDGSRWVEIAQANSLTNPQLIHAGDVLKLPRR